MRCFQETRTLFGHRPSGPASATCAQLARRVCCTPYWGLPRRARPPRQPPRCRPTQWWRRTTKRTRGRTGRPIGPATRRRRAQTTWPRARRRASTAWVSGADPRQRLAVGREIGRDYRHGNLAAIAPAGGCGAFRAGVGAPIQNAALSAEPCAPAAGPRARPPRCQQSLARRRRSPAQERRAVRGALRAGGGTLRKNAALPAEYLSLVRRRRNPTQERSAVSRAWRAGGGAPRKGGRTAS